MQFFGGNWSPWDRSKTRKRHPWPGGTELAEATKADRAAELERAKSGGRLVTRREHLIEQETRRLLRKYGALRD